MLTIIIPGTELYDEATSTFVKVPETKLLLEHSLLSISKWESFYEKPFLSKKAELSYEEFLYYVECMTISKDIDPLIYRNIQKPEFDKILNYISKPMTATTVTYRGKSKPSKEIITSELVYYWMFSFGIPKECEKWHLNRLLKLVEIFSVKGSSDKKMSKSELAAHNKSLNAARKARAHSHG